jgi:hypothetical protein
VEEDVREDADAVDSVGGGRRAGGRGHGGDWRLVMASPAKVRKGP